MIAPMFDGSVSKETMEFLHAKHPFRGLGEVEDIARAAVFLASDDCSWVTGIGLPVDGGYSAW